MSTGMILFLLGIVITGTDIGNRLVVMLNEESEVNGYFSQDTTEEERNALVNRIGRLDGVRSSRLVAEDEAKARMEDILGDEAKILELFDKNPFEACVEIRIEVNAMDSIIDEVRKKDGIEYVRDKREVLEKIQDITYALKIIGYLMIVAVGVTTLIILSHMIRQGIYNNKDQINTLRLLGSPGAFIGFPYILTGVILTLIGGYGLIHDYNNYKAYDGVASTILFISLPARGDIINKIIYGLPSLSLVLGFFGSLFGLSSIKEKS